MQTAMFCIENEAEPLFLLSILLYVFVDDSWFKKAQKPLVS